jgi:hypothetical protein
VHSVSAAFACPKLGIVICDGFSLQSLSQATADAVEQVAAQQQWRAQQQEAMAVLQARCVQLQALQADSEQEAHSANSHAEGELN